MKKTSSVYLEKLKDPRWQKKRLEILERDDFSCQKCGDEKKTLVVHHKAYEIGLEPWDYEENYLITLCQNCHDFLHKYAESCTDKQLSNAIKLGGFYQDDFPWLIEAFSQIQMPYPSHVVAPAILHLFKDENAMCAIVDSYFEKMKALHNAKG